jgi:hypothetical protein
MKTKTSIGVGFTAKEPAANQEEDIEEFIKRHLEEDK